MALQDLPQPQPGVAEGRFNGALGAAHDSRGFGDAKSDEVVTIDRETGATHVPKCSGVEETRPKVDADVIVITYRLRPADDRRLGHVERRFCEDVSAAVPDELHRADPEPIDHRPQGSAGRDDG
jgi:hypothetical protein